MMLLPLHQVAGDRLADPVDVTRGAATKSTMKQMWHQQVGIHQGTPNQPTTGGLLWR